MDLKIYTQLDRGGRWLGEVYNTEKGGMVCVAQFSGASDLEVRQQCDAHVATQVSASVPTAKPLLVPASSLVVPVVKILAPEIEYKPVRRHALADLDLDKPVVGRPRKAK
jgi:hypothetical protein